MRVLLNMDIPTLKPIPVVGARDICLVGAANPVINRLLGEVAYRAAIVGKSPVLII
jgi:hypothetical protein